MKATYVAAVVVVFYLALSAMDDRRDLGTDTSPSTLMGHSLPAAILATADSVNVDLLDYLASRPAFLFLVTAADCLSCGDYADELKLLQREHSDHATLLIGVGPDAGETLAYARRHRIEALVDLEGGLQAGLGTEHTPLFLAVGSDGTILHVDGRSGPSSKAMPTSRIMAALRRDLQPKDAK